jgi:hypothetical protein
MDNQNEMETPLKKLDFGVDLIDWKLIVGAILIILAGIGSGYGISTIRSSSSQPISQEEISMGGNGQKVKVGQTYGNKNDIFTDEATGVLEKNDQSGEGTHLLLREGGESQTAYLTSSLVNLDLFVGRKVKVWGETFAAQKVGWLMDVGAVKVLE